MDSLKKTLTLTLTTVFALSLMSPLCCHQDWLEWFGHGHKASAHAHEHDSSRGCSKHLLKDLSKPDRVSTFSTPPLSSLNIPVVDLAGRRFSGRLGKHILSIVFLNKAGPPIYLLNSVFLN